MTNNNKEVRLTWNQLRKLFMAYNSIKDDTNNAPLSKEPLHAVIVFKPSNWAGKYCALESISYHCQSDNNCFYEWSISRSCYCDALDGSDPHVDISKYNWEIDYCYLY